MLKGKNYCITTENVAVHEMIGLKAMVVNSTDRGKIGMKGKIVDERKNVFLIDTGKGEKIIPKKEAVFQFIIGKEKALLNGWKLVFRPEDRTKKIWRGKNAAN